MKKEKKDAETNKTKSNQIKSKCLWYGNITIIGFRIDFRDCNQVNNSLIFSPLSWMFVRFVMRKYSISLILAITRSGLLVDKCSRACMQVYYHKKVSQSLNSVWQWSLERKRVSFHKLNNRSLLTFEFYKYDKHDIFIIPAKFYRIWCLLQMFLQYRSIMG